MRRAAQYCVVLFYRHFCIPVDRDVGWDSMRLDDEGADTLEIMKTLLSDPLCRAFLNFF
jgi:hypothetical protein